MREKINEALNLINETIHKYKLESVYVGHSGGKDSCVIHHLTNLVVPGLMVVHNSKSGDHTHPETKKFLYDMSTAQEIRFIPIGGMENFIRANGLRLQIDGTRRDEAGRTEKSAIYVQHGREINRANMPAFVEDGLFGIDFLYPIYNWTDEEVFQYIKDQGLNLSDEYKQ